MKKYSNTENQLDPKNYWEKRLQNNWGLRGVGYVSYGRYYNQWLYKVRKRVFNYYIKELGFSSFEKLKILEDQGKIKVKDIGTLNPLFIEIIDKTIETEVINNPIVEVEERE